MLYADEIQDQSVETKQNLQVVNAEEGQFANVGRNQDIGVKLIQDQFARGDNQNQRNADHNQDHTAKKDKIRRNINVNHNHTYDSVNGGRLLSDTIVTDHHIQRNDARRAKHQRKTTALEDGVEKEREELIANSLRSLLINLDGNVVRFQWELLEERARNSRMIHQVLLKQCLNLMYAKELNTLI